MFKLPERKGTVTKRTLSAPRLIQLRTVLEVAGLIVLALTLRKVSAQRLTIRRLVSYMIAQGDADAEAAQGGQHG